MRLLYLPFDHLHREYGILKDADPTRDVIVLVQSERRCDPGRWNPIRLYFLISSARHFVALTGISEIWSAEPSSSRSEMALKEASVKFVPNDFFLTPRELFRNWAEGQNSFLMESFYRKQRARLNILMDGNDPNGGQWNFDKSNRLAPPKNSGWLRYFRHQQTRLI